MVEFFVFIRFPIGGIELADYIRHQEEQGFFLVAPVLVMDGILLFFGRGKNEQVHTSGKEAEK